MKSSTISTTPFAPSILNSITQNRQTLTPILWPSNQHPTSTTVSPRESRLRLSAILSEALSILDDDDLMVGFDSDLNIDDDVKRKKNNRNSRSQ